MIVVFLLCCSILFLTPNIHVLSSNFLTLASLFSSRLELFIEVPRLTRRLTLFGPPIPVFLFENYSMNRLLLSFACSALLASPLSALADSTATSTDSAAYQAREQLESQREQLSGVGGVAQRSPEANAFVDAPVDTDDAPALVSQP